MGQKQKTERLNDGNNKGQAMHGARKPPGPIPAANSTSNSTLIVYWKTINFHTREIPRSGSKAKDGERREGEKQWPATHCKRQLGITRRYMQKNK